MKERAVHDLYFANRRSINNNTGYRSLCCWNCARGAVWSTRLRYSVPFGVYSKLKAAHALIMFTALSGSHFPRSSREIRAVAQAPTPAVSSAIRDTMKSHRRFPVSYQPTPKHGSSTRATTFISFNRTTYFAAGLELLTASLEAPPPGRTWLRGQNTGLDCDVRALTLCSQGRFFMIQIFS